jgi:2-dehydro-3-deoxygalactonokinase
MTRRAEFVSIDWGTSSFRAYLADARGEALDTIESSRGAVSLAKGEHEGFLIETLAPWASHMQRLPIVMSGMIGSRQGWLEAPYAACPAGEDEIAAALVAVPCESLAQVFIVPGISAMGEDGAPDVIRGEETQIIGAMRAAGGRDGVFVLPGSHSKWARVEEGRIVGFKTYMTGEVFAALKDHTVLGRLMPAPTGATSGETGFRAGVAAARRLRRPGDLLHAVFMTRTLGLFDLLPAAELADYLSGLLIGAEILAGAQGAARATIVGSAALDARYRAAGAELGLEFATAPLNSATLGQLAILGRRGKPSA